MGRQRHYHVVVDIVSSSANAAILLALDDKKRQGWKSYATCRRRVEELAKDLKSMGVEVVHQTTRACEADCDLDSDRYTPWRMPKRTEHDLA